MAVWDIKERNDLVRANEVRGSRGFFMGGTTPSAVSDIYQLDITSTGNAVDFGGNLQGEQKGAGKGCNAGSAIRIIYGGGISAPAAPANGASTQISHFTPIHSGNASDFGDLTLRRTSLISLSNNTRALFGGGYDYAGAPASSGTNKDIIDFITIQSLGNAIDFGDLQQTKQNNASCASTTRGVWAGGHTPGGTINQIDFVTIASAGNAADFGDLSAVSESFAGSGSNIKGIVGGGNQGPYAGMDVITIATTGNGTDFGDLTQARRDCGSTSNQIRQVFGGGAAPGITNIIDFLQIASLGNASDFGDLAAANRGNAGSSVSHSGLELGLPQRPSVTYMPGSGRALFGGGYVPGANNVVGLINIPTLGNAVDFGNLAVATAASAGASSLTRALYSGGVQGGTGAGNDVNQIQAIEFASLGNAFDFGDITSTCYKSSGLASLTRGICVNGNSDGATNVIDYITMASAGNAADFGNQTTSRFTVGCCGSPTRGVMGGGSTPDLSNIIDYITIASTGNATDFGDLAAAIRDLNASGSSVRGLWMGGYTSDDSDVVQYVTIASTGNTSDFGDLTQARATAASASTNIRAIAYAGDNPGLVNTIDYVTIATTGNAADFGDATSTRRRVSSGNTSDSHGGLQG